MKLLNCDIMSLQSKLDDWIYSMAYFTNEDIATPKGVHKWVQGLIDESVEDQSKLDALPSIEELARLITQVSEHTYYGKAFTYNYMVDVLAEAIHKRIEGGKREG